MNRNDALSAYGVDLNEVMERFVNDEELYYECLNTFIDDPSFDGLHNALLEKEYEAAFHHAHTLKGVAGNLGLCASRWRRGWRAGAWAPSPASPP